MARRFEYNDVQRFLDSKNITLLSKKYKNNSTKLKLLCRNCDRVWSATFANIRAGRGCPGCAGRERLTYDYIKRFLNNLGLELLSDKYVNAKTCIKVRCSCGKITNKTFDVIQRGHIGCKKCSAKKRASKNKHSISYIKKTISDLDGILISNTYKNKDSRLKVLCKKCDNIFNPTFGSILSGSWCPVCCRFGSKEQKKLFSIIKKLFNDKNIKYNYKSNWLGKQHIDIYVEDIGLAIEYDGIQHFEPRCFGGIDEKQARKNFEYIVKKDKEKEIKIRKNKNIRYFVRFSYKEKITEEDVLNKLIACNIM